MVHEDPPHERRGHREEMRPVSPRRVLPDEPQIRFVDQRSRLQGMAGRLLAQIARGTAAQIAVDERHQPFRRRLRALAPGLEQLRDRLGPRPHEHPRRRALA